MFWTAFVWGAGVSLGASIGLMAFVFMYAAFRKIVDSEAYERAEAYQEYIKAALSHRNELAMEANAHLAVIADAYLECAEEDEDDDLFSDDESWRG